MVSITIVPIDDYFVILIVFEDIGVSEGIVVFDGVCFSERIGFFECVGGFVSFMFVFVDIVFGRELIELGGDDWLVSGLILFLFVSFGVDYVILHRSNS